MFQNNATSHIALQSDPYSDADKIANATRGMHKDFDLINHLIAHRTLDQRTEIRRAFQTRYNKDLLVSLGKDLHGDYESLVKSLFRSPIELLAYDIYRELKKSGNNTSELTNILCCCNNTEIYLLKKAYATILEAEDVKRASHRSLETDVRKETKGAYSQLLDELLKCERYEESPEELQNARATGDVFIVVDHSLVEKDIYDIHTAMHERGHKPEPKVLISIMTKRSKTHIKAIWKAYIYRYNTNLVKEISEKFSEPFRTGINTLIMTQIDLRLLLVCQLREAMVGLGTNETALNRIICLRLETDLPQIKADYAVYFGRDLVKDVQSDTSSDYRKLLTLLLNR